MKSLSLVGKLIAQPLWAGSADVGAPADVLMGSVLASVATLEALRRGTREGFLQRHIGEGETPSGPVGCCCAESSEVRILGSITGRRRHGADPGDAGQRGLGPPALLGVGVVGPWLVVRGRVN